jgi:hypothetical protein
VLVAVTDVDAGNPHVVGVRVRLYAEHLADHDISPAGLDRFYILYRMSQHVEGMCQLDGICRWQIYVVL